jgi:hypothetical protein
VEQAEMSHASFEWSERYSSSVLQGFQGRECKMDIHNYGNTETNKYSRGYY